MQRVAWQRRAAVGCAMLLVLMSACGDDASDSKGSNNKDATAAAGTTQAEGKGKPDAGSDSGAGPMRRPTAGNGSAPESAANAAAYHCQPSVLDIGGYQRQDETCCSGLGVCVSGDRATPWLSRDTCSASADLRCEPMAAAGNGGGNGSGAAASAGDDAGTGPSTHCRVQLPGTPAGGTDYEGRCVNTCFVRGSPIFSRLSQATCATGQTCAPCYDPLTSASTGYCERDGDAPREAAPEGFAECGTGLGYCVPEYAAGAQASQLMRLTCGTGELCAPKIKVADPNACFGHCSSTLGPGACVPSFLAAGLGMTFLSQSECNDAETCAPCEVFGMRIGVCD